MVQFTELCRDKKHCRRVREVYNNLGFGKGLWYIIKSSILKAASYLCPINFIHIFHSFCIALKHKHQRHMVVFPL